MKKFVAYEKLSKKQKREIDKAGRATWGSVNPVWTVVNPSSKVTVKDYYADDAKTILNTK